jgi:hypothetical protein
MTNTEAARIVRLMQLGRQGIGMHGEMDEALSKAITALEHQPEPQIADIEHKGLTLEGGTLNAFECNVCHWRTLDTTRTLCDACGSFELAPVSDIGQVKP